MRRRLPNEPGSRLFLPSFSLPVMGKASLSSPFSFYMSGIGKKEKTVFDPTPRLLCPSSFYLGPPYNEACPPLSFSPSVGGREKEFVRVERAMSRSSFFFFSVRDFKSSSFLFFPLTPMETENLSGIFGTATSPSLFRGLSERARRSFFFFTTADDALLISSPQVGLTLFPFFLSPF